MTVVVRGWSRHEEAIETIDRAALVARLSSSDAVVREKAREELVVRGRSSVEPLIEALSDKMNQTRWEAAKALVCLRAPEAAPALVTALGDERFGVRWLAAEALISLGWDALEPLLTELTRPAVFWRAEGAHHVLRHLAALESNEFLQPVVAALEDPELEIAVPFAAETALRKLRGLAGREALAPGPRGGLVPGVKPPSRKPLSWPQRTPAVRSRT
jgi:HEAT repeat protein